MIVLWDEFGASHQAPHITIRSCEDQGNPDLYCLYVNGHCATQPHIHSLMVRAKREAISRIQAGAPVNLSELIQEVLDDMKAPLQEMTHPVSSPEPGRGDLY